jgi:hypothetical protein
VLLKDCVGDLPPVTETQISVKTPKYLKKPDDKLFFDEHRWEQQGKSKEILDIGKGYRKIIVVVFYIEEILKLEKELSKDRETFVVYGGVSNQEEVIEKAQKSDECYLIIQSSVGVGWDGDSFSCLVFSSMSYSVRDYVQMKGRVRRIHNLHPVFLNYLIGGRCDRAILDNISKGKEFIPSEWISSQK